MPPLQPNPVPSSSKSSGFLRIFFIALALILFGILVGVLAARFLPMSNPSVAPEITPTETITDEITEAPLETPTPTLDETVSWKTYKSPNLGYEIKYPSSVKIEKEQDAKANQSTVFKGDDLNFQVMLLKNPGDITLEDYNYMDFPSIKKTTLSGIPANIYEMPYGSCELDPSCNKPNISIVALNNSDIYYLSFIGHTKLSNLENQIISTFKITGPADTLPTEDNLIIYLKDSLEKSNKSLGITKDKIDIDNIKIVGNYATGTETFYTATGDPRGGGVWFATIVNGQWALVEETQEPPSCQLMTQFKFPKEIYGSCIIK